MRIRCPNCHHGLEIVPDTPAEFITCPSCGSQLDPNSGETVTYKPETRQMIGHFELLEHVGRGHFGNVWRARDTQLKRIVAVKIPRTADLTESDRQFFLREAQTAAKLRHANIVTVHEVGYDEDAIFIVSDFIQGVPLSEQLKIRQPSFAESARWCAAVADALDYAHEQGVIHRDMKPGNIMLEGEDKLFVLDFGLAKTEGGDFTITTEGEILGTPAYMSPEQARGDASNADRRSDVYSLGVVLYEMLTGEKPFKGATRSLVHQILNEEPKSPRRLKREVPRDLETICLRAMAKEPDRRYATAKEMADDLRRYLAGEPIHARPVRWPERTWRWVRRNPALSLASGVAAVAVLLLVGQLGQWLLAGPEPTPQPPIFVQGPIPKNISLTVLKREHADPKAKTSEAENAEVVFWRLDPDSGEPDLEHPERNTGPSPLSFRLIPGNYLVVVNIPDHGFHEVYRHVPGDGKSFADSFNHTWASSDGDGGFQLPRIQVPPRAEVAQGMVAFPSLPVFDLGSDRVIGAPPYQRRIAAFLLDPQEVSVEEYARFSQPDPALKRATEAVRLVPWDFAVAYAEKVGKRLPEEFEYEFAATNGGKSKYPWKAGAAPEANWELGNDPQASEDLTDTSPAVRGLFSGVAEWTWTWASPYPSDRKKGMVNRDIDKERIARGAPYAVIKGEKHLRTDDDDPRQRLAIARMPGRPGLGFRCARSLVPRLRDQDFSIPLNGD